MQEYVFLDEKRYPLAVTTTQPDMLPYYRWEHRATIGFGTREFIVIVDAMLGSGYMEEIIGGHLETIKDDSLYNSLYKFVSEHSLLRLLPPILKPKENRFF